MKIHARYRKPISQRRFDSMKLMLADDYEKQLLERAFTADARKKYSLTGTLGDQEQRELIRVLKGIRKARSGPRTMRLIILALVFLPPVLFNLFFLDSWASLRLERVLERWSGTDVTVAGLDISILKARASLGKMAFASLEEPLVDSWSAENLLIDGDMTALLQRRFVLDSVKGEVRRNVPRNSPARYPSASETMSDRTVQPSRLFTDFNIDISMLLGEMNFDSLSLAEQLRSEQAAELEDRYAAINSSIDADISEAELLLNDVRTYIDTAVPDTQDLGLWMKHIEQGRRLYQALEAQGQTFLMYRDTLGGLSAEAQRMGLEIRNAVQNDINRIQDSLKLDDDTLNSLVQKALVHYGGQRFVSLYRKAAPLLAPVINRKSEKSGEAARIRSQEDSRRLGRRVDFPVQLPPRFSIRSLFLSGEGLEITGENVGIDHRLAGSPSILNTEMDGRILGSPDSKASVLLVADGRVSADIPVSANVQLFSYPWRLEEGQLSGMGGLMNISGLLEISTISADTVSGGFEADLSLMDWSSDTTSRFVNHLADFVSEMNLSLKGGIVENSVTLSAALTGDSISEWSTAVLNALLPGGSQAVQQELEAMAGEELEYFSTLANTYSREEDAVSEFLEDRTQLKAELENRLNDFADPVSGGSGKPEPESLIGGLKSLF